MHPRAIGQGLLTDQIGDELLIYNRETHQAYCLIPAAAAVWRWCDGQTSVAELSQKLRDSVDPQADDAAVEKLLAELDQAGLLESASLPRGESVSRRRALIGLGGAIAGAVAVMTVHVPSAMAAASPLRTPTPAPPCAPVPPPPPPGPPPPPPPGPAPGPAPPCAPSPP